MDFNASFPDFLLSSLEFFSRLSGNRISMAKAGMRNTPGIDSGRDATPLGLGYTGAEFPVGHFALRKNRNFSWRLASIPIGLYLLCKSNL